MAHIQCACRSIDTSYIMQSENAFEFYYFFKGTKVHIKHFVGKCHVIIVYVPR